MKLIEVSKEEFKNLADKSEQITFHQTMEWANLKSVNGWKHFYVSLDDDGKSCGCALLLAKKIPLFNKYMFYSPRGFLVDYKDYKTLENFTKEIKLFVKKNNGIFVKIDPYVAYKEHDNDGKLVQGGFDNSIVVDNLKRLGYKHFGFNLMQDTLQPRWMHVINTDRNMDEVLKDMESKTRQILRKNEKCGITTREIERSELPKFKDIMQHTSDRREFVDRPLSYYEKMWDSAATIPQNSNQFNSILLHPIIYLQKPGDRLRRGHQLAVPGHGVVGPAGQQCFQCLLFDNGKQRRRRVRNHPPQLATDCR